MTTLLLTHPDCLDHDPGELHPECPDRLRAVLSILEREDFVYLARDYGPLATATQLERAHPPDYISRIMASMPPPGEYREIGEDTVISAGSGMAALRAAGIACAAVDEVMDGRCRNAFCAVRPPGHHAGRAVAAGFCLFSNAAIAALHARDHYQLKRVAVVDFDVHHGNGTQEVLWSEPGTFYASTHEMDAYPYTGTMSETGPPGGCTVVNVPLMAGTGSDDFRTAYSDLILPRLRQFRPELILLSAGFDGHAADPLANFKLTVRDYDWLTRQLVDLAAECCGKRLVSVLEGGYDTRALSACVAAHVRALIDA